MFNSWMFYLVLGLSASTAALGWLSLSLHDDKVVAVEALVQAININSEMQKSLNLQVKSCEISDTITSEYQTEKQAQQDKAQSVISKIDILPKKTIQAPSNEINDINIDSKLPNDLIRLLSESCLPDEGDACVSPR